MDLRLQGHVVLVVGGTGLIGRAVVERILTEGGTPVVGARMLPSWWSTPQTTLLSMLPSRSCG
jgi:nucleoside-diphosphate-sugar epimerase